MVRRDSSVQILLSILGVISLILITVGVSFAFFTHEKQIAIENNLNEGKIALIYTKNLYSDRGLSITNFTPVDDSLGKNFNSDKYIFDFRIVGNSLDNPEIPYEITLRKDLASILGESSVKVYLTEITEEGEVATEFTTSSGKVKTFDILKQTEMISASEEIEKTIYQGVIPANTASYEKSFRLRIWIAEENSISARELLPKELPESLFQVELNVYASAKTISKGEVVEATALTISDISPMVLGGTQEIFATFTPVTTTDQTLTWVSNHPEIVSVAKTEDGRTVLIANNVGTAVIQVTSKNGVMQTANVTVLPPVTPTPPVNP